MTVLNPDQIKAVSYVKVHIWWRGDGQAVPRGGQGVWRRGERDAKRPAVHLLLLIAALSAFDTIPHLPPSAKTQTRDIYPSHTQPIFVKLPLFYSGMNRTISPRDENRRKEAGRIGQSVANLVS